MSAPVASDSAAQIARYDNSLIGLAAGDAWGFQVEFRKYADMPAYPVPAPAGEWMISDDTQMTLALHDALVEVTDFGDIPAVTDSIVRHFIKWELDPDNFRAPGMTCMGSLANLRGGANWYDADGARKSAGCGAVMRLTPAAFGPESHWLGLTALQAVITHKHPRAVIPALLLADATRHAHERGGVFLEHSLASGRAVVDGSSHWIDDPYLNDVLAPIVGDMSSYLIKGLNDGVTEALTNAIERRDALRFLGSNDPSSYGDPCVGIGEGWESASATALALLVADMATGSEDEPAHLTGPQALAWASTSNGDSDSIACMAGALIGAAHSEPDYWSRNGLNPTFEPRYAQELDNAHYDGLAKTLD